jgi:hypothetical protein
MRPTPIIAESEQEALLKARSTAAVSGFTGEITIMRSDKEPRGDEPVLTFENGREVRDTAAGWKS